MFDINQFREQLIKPVLHGIGMWDQYAEELMVGTCAVESDGGTYLVQMGGGPAVGIFQMEPRTHDDIWTRFFPDRPAILANVMTTCHFKHKPQANYMIANLAYACAMARVQYFRATADKVPSQLERQAEWWVKYYNCGGAGTVEKYISAYNKFIGGENHGQTTKQSQVPTKPEPTRHAAKG